MLYKITNRLQYKIENRYKITIYKKNDGYQYFKITSYLFCCQIKAFIYLNFIVIIVIMLCIKKFASYIRIYYYYSYNCFKDIKDNIYIFYIKKTRHTINFKNDKRNNKSIFK